ncbi:tyrosine-type recombinase/integrase [Parasalinivibrio latis]|uniref:phage integrase n=1 Tax=Parasalinivibrio latis TaxID=2952610 RepID=UPI0030E21562
MAVRNLKDGSAKPWLCDCFPFGKKHGKRVRKRFATKGEALAFERFELEKASAKPWLGESKDCRSLLELAELWFQLHGQHLKGGEKSLSRLKNLIEELGNPMARTFTAKEFLHWRAHRRNRFAAEYGKDKAVSAATHNVDLSLLKAVYNYLIAADEISYPNPLVNVRRVKSDQADMSYLSEDEIVLFIGSLANARKGLTVPLQLVTKICLATGCRISEAENLAKSRVTKYKLTFTNTKSGQNRTVPIAPWLYNEITEYEKEHGLPFPEVRKNLEKRLGKAFPHLPAGQKTHVFRHTFASLFMQKGGDILTLQRILGHANITMTMRYAHHSPGHLAQATELNPLVGLIG